MTELQIGDQKILYDRDATIAIYQCIDRSWADKCRCLSCKNFLAHRDRVYPPSFLALLDQLGIDPKKESEIIEHPILDDYARDRLHWYDGWLNFIGAFISGGDIVQAPDADHFEYYFVTGLPGIGGFYDRKPSIAIEFETPLRWIIPERPESHDTAGNTYIWTENGEHVKVKPEK
jgi:hypothetical protein